MTGIVLAGGAGRRLHPAKCTLSLAGKPLIAHVIASLDPIVDRVVVSATSLRPYQRYDVPVVADCFRDSGPLAGMHAAMKAYADADYLVVAGDMPFVSQRVLRRLLAEWERSAFQALVPLDADGRRQPLQAIYAHSCLPAIEQRLRRGERRVGAFLDAVQTHYVDLGALAGRSFFNVNTPAALAQAREIASDLSDAPHGPPEPGTSSTGNDARS